MNEKFLQPQTDSHLTFNHGIAALKAEMNRLFETLSYDLDESANSFEDPPRSFSQMLPKFAVKIDLNDSGKQFVLTAEVPGMDLNDMTLATTSHYVSLSGEKKKDRDTHSGDHYRRERDFGYFRRVIQLPTEIDPSAVDAIYKDGLLTITLPKSRNALSEERKIGVKAG